MKKDTSTNQLKQLPKGGKASEVKKPFNPDDYTSLKLTREEVIDIRIAFMIFDSDGSGKIDPQELKKSLQQLKVQGRTKLNYQILAQLDEDQSGGIEFDEFFKLATAKIGDKDSRVEIDNVFKLYDLKRTDKFSIDQLKRVAKDIGENLTEEQIQNFLSKQTQMMINLLLLMMIFITS